MERHQRTDPLRPFLERPRAQCFLRQHSRRHVLVRFWRPGTGFSGGRPFFCARRLRRRWPSGSYSQESQRAATPRSSQRHERHRQLDFFSIASKRTIATPSAPPLLLKPKDIARRNTFKLALVSCRTTPRNSSSGLVNSLALFALPSFGPDGSTEVFEHLPINHRIEFQEGSAAFLAKVKRKTPSASSKNRSRESRQPLAVARGLSTKPKSSSAAPWKSPR